MGLRYRFKSYHHAGGGGGDGGEKGGLEDIGRNGAGCFGMRVGGLGGFIR